MTWRMTWLGAVALLCPLLAIAAPSAPPSPEAYFGHVPGADRTIIDYDQLVGYFEKIDAASDRVQLFHLGRTTEGRDFVMLAISTPENLVRTAYYRRVAAALNDPR